MHPENDKIMQYTIVLSCFTFIQYGEKQKIRQYDQNQEKFVENKKIGKENHLHPPLCESEFSDRQRNEDIQIEAFIIYPTLLQPIDKRMRYTRIFNGILTIFDI